MRFMEKFEESGLTTCGHLGIFWSLNLGISPGRVPPEYAGWREAAFTSLALVCGQCPVQTRVLASCHLYTFHRTLAISL